jgi:hypothetical protein
MKQEACVLPIPELQEEYLDLLEEYDRRMARGRGIEIEEEDNEVENTRGAQGYSEPRR